MLGANYVIQKFQHLVFRSKICAGCSPRLQLS